MAGFSAAAVGRGFDMNCLPPADEDDSSSSSPPEFSNLFSLAPSPPPWPAFAALKRRIDDEDEEEEEEEEAGIMTRKKLRLSKDQSAVLEQSFRQQSTLNPKQKMALAKQLDLKPRQVEVWFQNRRARTKLKQTEMDCELLRRCCESLTEENRRLQKEVQELRALKVFTRDHPMHLPAATLAMCPSCEKVGPATSIGRTTASLAPFLPKFPAIAGAPSAPSRQFSFFRQPSAA